MCVAVAVLKRFVSKNRGIKGRMKEPPVCGAIGRVRRGVSTCFGRYRNRVLGSSGKGAMLGGFKGPITVGQGPPAMANLTLTLKFADELSLLECRKGRRFYGAVAHTGTEMRRCTRRELFSHSNSGNTRFDLEGGFGK